MNPSSNPDPNPKQKPEPIRIPYTDADQFRRDFAKILCGRFAHWENIPTRLSLSGHEVLSQCYDIFLAEITHINATAKVYSKEPLPELTQLFGIFGSVFGSDEKYERALETFLEIAKRGYSPEALCWAHATIGSTYHRLELFDEAVEHLGIALSYNKGSLVPLQYLIAATSLADCLWRDDGFKLGDRDLIEKCDQYCVEAMQIIDARAHLSDAFQGSTYVCDALQCIVNTQKALAENSYTHSFDPGILLHRLALVNSQRCENLNYFPHALHQYLLYSRISESPEESLGLAVSLLVALADAPDLPKNQRSAFEETAITEGWRALNLIKESDNPAPDGEE